MEKTGVKHINWHDYFIYDESSVTFLRWKICVISGKNGSQINCDIGDVAGSLPVDYRYHSIVCVDNRHYLVHRVIWEMFNGHIDNKDIIEHFDGNGNNNMIGNLRRVSQAVNMRNCKLRVDNKTGVCGVTEYTSRYFGFVEEFRW